LYKKKIPEMIREVPGVPGTKERELAEKWGMSHETGDIIYRYTGPQVESAAQ
jgi:hypothetical protein